MKTIVSLAGCVILCMLLVSAAPAAAQDPGSIQLAPPQTEGGRPLMQVLKDRQSSRAFSGEALPPQVLSNMLWAAIGINRPDSGKRTAPSARNWQEIDVYVAMADGLYVYDPKGHALKGVLATDLRALTGRQAFAGEVPVNLVYVADFSRMRGATDDDKILYSAAGAGFISQNVYLYCASEGLATVVRGSIDRSTLAKAMNLRSDQRILLAQSVGYPKK